MVMKAVPEAEAIALFAQRMNPFLTLPPPTARVVLDEFIGFCREVPVQDAEDSVMFEWGSQQPHLLRGFTDLRECSVVEWEERAFQWIGLTRQIRSNRGDDDTALCTSIYFEKAAGDEPSSSMEFEGLDQLESHLGRFLQKAYVAKLLRMPPSRVTAFASEVG